MSSAIRLRAAALLLLCGAIGGAVVWSQARQPPGRGLDQTLREAESALQLGKFARAVELAEEALRQNPHSSTALLIAGQAAGKAGQTAEALAYLTRITDDDRPVEVEGANLHGGKYTAAAPRGVPQASNGRLPRSPR